jgi:hypothetical protein
MPSYPKEANRIEGVLSIGREKEQAIAMAAENRRESFEHRRVELVVEMGNRYAIRLDLNQ